MSEPGTVESPGEIGEGGFGSIETINVEVDGEIIEAKLVPDVLGTQGGEFTVGECVTIESGVYVDDEGEERGSEDEWIVVTGC